MTSLLGNIAVSACLGALIGLIRQWGEQAEPNGRGGFAGVRTHTLWAVLGALGMIASEQCSPLAFPIVVLAVTAELIVERVRSDAPDAPGSTSLAAALLTLFAGALVVWDEPKSAVLVAAITMLVLGSKQPIHAWTRSINAADIRATLQFVAIAGVVLPLLPHRDMGPYGAFNPFSTWLMVVLISGLGFAGYVAMRMLGDRAGILLMGLLGGLASSTATTLAFSRRSREQPELSEHYALAVIAACTVMLPRVLVLAAVINQSLAQALIVPFAAMSVPGVAYALWRWRRGVPADEAGGAPRLSNPLNLRTAIKFAAIYSVIAFAVQYVRANDLTGSLLPLSFVSGLTDLDAITLSIARERGGGESVPVIAVQAVVVAAIANTLLKAGLGAVLGSPALRWRITAVLVATALAGAAWIGFAW